MRILHTSDWHLGHLLLGQSRHAEHQRLIAWLGEQIRQQQIDVVLLAGDVFDSATPTSAARELYFELAMTVEAAGAQLVVVAGNHDAAATLQESRVLLEKLQTWVIPHRLSAADHVRLLKNRQGEPALWLAAVPYLRPHEVLLSRAGQDAEEKELALQQAIADCYAEIFFYIQAQQTTLARPVPIMMTGHLTVLGGSSSESVREIYIGKLRGFPATAFPKVDYVALGHLHQAQHISASLPIYYSGSPLALSFDEASQQKSMNLIECQSDGLQVHTLPVPCWQALASIQTSMETLVADVESRLSQLAIPPPHTLWLEIVLTDPQTSRDVVDQVREQLASYPVQVLRVKRALREVSLLQPAHTVMLHELSVQEVFEQCLSQTEFDATTCQALQQRFDLVCQQLEIMQ